MALSRKEAIKAQENISVKTHLFKKSHFSNDKGCISWLYIEMGTVKCRRK